LIFSFIWFNGIFSLQGGDKNNEMTAVLTGWTENEVRACLAAQ
jgi:hypothetical protein